MTFDTSALSAALIRSEADRQLDRAGVTHSGAREMLAGLLASGAVVEPDVLDGAPTVRVRSGDGGSITLAARLDELRHQHARLFGAPTPPADLAAERQRLKHANPWAAPSFNLTEQMRLDREQPVLAERLRRLARGDG